MFSTTICRMHTAGWSSWRPTPNTDQAGNAFALKWFARAQELDEFADTPPEDGSSVNGAAKAAREAGIVKSWAWARSVDDVIDALIAHGPGVLGTPWLEGMFHYDPNYVVDVSGSVAGGHAICVDGYYPSWHGVEAVRVFNSWGMWGDRGRAYIPVAKLHDLWDRGAEFASYTT
jgi:hypothetical protein